MQECTVLQMFDGSLRILLLLLTNACCCVVGTVIVVLSLVLVLLMSSVARDADARACANIDMCLMLRNEQCVAAC